MGKYQTILADPPWPERGGGKIKRGADRHYKLMSLDEIYWLKVEQLAAYNAHLYLWVTNNYLQAGLASMNAWGFRYITNIVWCKPSFGIGQYFRGQHEILLFGVRGKLPSQAVPKNIPTILHAPKGEHSAKPEQIYSYIERTSPAPRIELFARKKREGWDVWGNEVESDIDLHAQP